MGFFLTLCKDFRPAGYNLLKDRRYAATVDGGFGHMRACFGCGFLALVTQEYDQVKHILRKITLLFAAAFMCTASITSIEMAVGGGEAQAQVKAKKVKAPKANQRPSLSYRPESVTEAVKYAERIGILTMRDQRVMKFYGGSDAFFVESVTTAINEALFYEFKTGRLFTKVVNIRVDPGKRLSPAELAALAEQHDVDLLFQADIDVFNMLREKVVKSNEGGEFQIKVRFGFFGQLIEPKSGSILWADQINHEFSTLNTSGVVESKDYGPSSVRAIQAVLADLKNFIRSL